MAERLKLVRDFGELRAGMICVGGPCKPCGVMHRFILLTPNREETGNIYGDVLPRDLVFPCAPNAPCIPPMTTAVVTRNHVRRGRIWRVEDGLEDTTTTETSHAAPRKRERAR